LADWHPEDLGQKGEPRTPPSGVIVQLLRAGVATAAGEVADPLPAAARARLSHSRLPQAAYLSVARESRSALERNGPPDAAGRVSGMKRELDVGQLIPPRAVSWPPSPMTSSS